MRSPESGNRGEGGSFIKTCCWAVFGALLTFGVVTWASDRLAARLDKWVVGVRKVVAVVRDSGLREPPAGKVSRAVVVSTTALDFVEGRTAEVMKIGPVAGAPFVGPALVETGPAGTRLPKKVALTDLDLPFELVERIEAELGLGPPDEPERAVPPAGGGIRASSDGAAHPETAAGSGNDLGPWSYRTAGFVPGTTSSGVPIREVPSDFSDLDARVLGPPDYTLASKTPLLSRILSLGNGGEITLEIVGGDIVDGEGPDFVVFENPFVHNGPDGIEVWAETGVVSVAEANEPATFRAFPCQPEKPPYSGCAGVTPVRYAAGWPLDKVGGDVFDLRDVGLPRARYIRIRDTGDNRTLSVGTEGFDLDAAALLHSTRQ